MGMKWTMIDVRSHVADRVKVAVRQAFFKDLLIHTENFGHVTWMGQPIWQNILDLWSIQEAIAEIKPSLLVETGTNKGGSALFYANLFDLMDHGRVITVDVRKMHELSHPRIEFLIGGSVDSDVLERVRVASTEADGPVMVILDSDHAQQHVAAELEAYAPFVTTGSLLLAQDGVIDTLRLLKGDRPGPLPAIESFLSEHPEFRLDDRLNARFLITHHPSGWLRRS
jgi:cephalosporin hydroxylase